MDVEGRGNEEHRVVLNFIGAKMKLWQVQTR